MTFPDLLQVPELSVDQHQTVDNGSSSPVNRGIAASGSCRLSMLSRPGSHGSSDSGAVMDVVDTAGATNWNPGI